ncbi:hypothetical protein GCM10010178_86860 [Lentzea flava]|uniref:Uncharacterized protein n=1 Tax=Lentzea flava TaxID=103732 RepID=A0ABQ2VEJ6_9PSEU|nr:hypothetical protein GCM10010178_86860 [Lentzea flava]
MPLHRFEYAAPVILLSHYIDLPGAAHQVRNARTYDRLTVGRDNSDQYDFSKPRVCCAT